MSRFTLEDKQDFGSIQTKLYSYREEGGQLSAYLRNKVRQPVQSFNDLLINHAGENINKEEILAKYNECCTPSDHPVPAFDVKRSTVTEFMAEFLLEKEFQCIFFEEVNKKLNKSIVDAERHSTGVDIVGIQESGDNLKFVVGEVKASSDSSIPCRSADSLKDDVCKLLDFDNKRIYKEIFTMMNSLKNESLLEKYISFLLELIGKENSLNLFVEKVIIFPFLIRKNPEILKQKNLNDFENFSELDTREAEIIGIVWAINKDINDFVDSIYNND